jgi:hypothetical protein
VDGRLEGRDRQLRLHGLDRPARLARPRASANFFWSVMSKAYGCYGISLRGASGAHAIALCHDRQNRYHLFDANYFHVVMDSESAFKTYVTRYLDKTKYKTTYSTKCGIVGIRPPHQ